MDAGQNRLVKGGGVRAVVAGKPVPRRKPGSGNPRPPGELGGTAAVRVVNYVIEKDYGTNQSRPFSMRGPEVYGSTYFRRSGGGNGNPIQAFQAVVRAASILAVRIKPRSRIGRNGENSAA